MTSRLLRGAAPRGHSGGGGAADGEEEEEEDDDDEMGLGGGGGSEAALYSRHAARVSLLLLLLQRSMQPPRVMDAMQTYLGALAARIAATTTAPVPPARTLQSGGRMQEGGRRGQHAYGWACLQRLMRHLISLPAMATRTEALLELARHMCHSGGTQLAATLTAALRSTVSEVAYGEGGEGDSVSRRGDTAGDAADDSHDGARTGGPMLLAIFGSVSASRPAILVYIFEALSQEDTSPSQRALWAALLTSISSANVYSLHAHAAQLIDATCSLPTLPPPSSRAVLRALLPLVPLHVDFGRHLMLLLRKSLVAPDARARAFAVEGFCTILATDLLADEPDAIADVLLALRSACRLSPSLQARAYRELARPLAIGRPRGHPAAAMALDLLIEPLHTLIDSDADGDTAGGHHHAAEAWGSVNDDAPFVAASAALAQRPLDALWAEALLNAAWRNGGSEAGVVLPSLLRAACVAAAVTPPAGAAAKHARLATALDTLASSMRAARLVHALKAPTKATASASDQPEYVSLPAAELSRLAIARVNVITSAAIALATWRSHSTAAHLEPPRGGGGKAKAGALVAGAVKRVHSAGGPRASGGASDGISHHSASQAASAAEMVRGALLAAEATLGGGRAAFPVASACGHALAPMHTCLQTTDAAAGGTDGSGSRCDATLSSADAPHSSIDAAVNALTDAAQVMERCAADDAPVTTSMIAAAGLLSAHALTSLALHLTAHTAAAAQVALLDDLHGDAHADKAPHVPSSASSSSARGASAVHVEPASEGTDGGLLSSSRLHDVLSTLIAVHAAARVWETTTRNGRHPSNRETRRPATRRGMSTSTHLALPATPVGASSVGCAAGSDDEGGGMLAGAAGGNDAAVLVVERELKFSAVEQEECSVEIRGAVLWLIRRTVTMLPPTTKSDPALDRGAPPLPAVEAAAASGSAIIPSYEALAPAADSLSPREMVFRRTLSCFSVDIAEGIPVPLLQAYLALLDDLAGAGRAAAASEAAAAARAVLCRYPIDHANSLKGLLGLMLRCTRGVGPAAVVARDIMLDAIGAPSMYSLGPSLDTTTTIPVGAIAAGGNDAAVAGGVAVGVADRYERSVTMTAASPEAATATHGGGTATAADALAINADDDDDGLGDEGVNGDDDDDGGGGGGGVGARMQLGSSTSIRVACLHIAMLHWKGQLDALPPPTSPDAPSVFAAVMAPMADGLRSLLVLTKLKNADVHERAALETVRQPAVAARTLVLMNALLTTTARATHALKASLGPRGSAKASGGNARGSPKGGFKGGGRGMATSNGAVKGGRSGKGVVGLSSLPVASADGARSDLVGWLPVWRPMASLLRLFPLWLRQHASGWTVACQRRVPPLLYSCERTTMAILGVLESTDGARLTRADATAASVLTELRDSWTAASSQRKPPSAKATHKQPARGGGASVLDVDEPAEIAAGKASGRKRVVPTPTPSAVSAATSRAVASPPPEAPGAPRMPRADVRSSAAPAPQASKRRRRGGGSGDEEEAILSGDDDEEEEEEEGWSAADGEEAADSSDDDEKGSDDDDDDGAIEAALARRTRRRFRSRNPYIDIELGDGYGADTFADLEDFIVCKKGRRY